MKATRDHGKLREGEIKREKRKGPEWKEAQQLEDEGRNRGTLWGDQRV